MVYAFVNLIVTNTEKLDAYRAVAADALARHNGKVMTVSPNVTALDGNGHDTGVGVILEFPDADSAHAWINDPDLTETHALRRGAGESNITLLA